MSETTPNANTAEQQNQNFLKHLVDEIYIHGEESWHWTKREVEILLALIGRRHIEKVGARPTASTAIQGGETEELQGAKNINPSALNNEGV